MFYTNKHGHEHH